RDKKEGGIVQGGLIRQGYARKWRTKCLERGRGPRGFPAGGRLQVYKCVQTNRIKGFVHHKCVHKCVQEEERSPQMTQIFAENHQGGKRWKNVEERET